MLCAWILLALEILEAEKALRLKRKAEEDYQIKMEMNKKQAMAHAKLMVSDLTVVILNTKKVTNLLFWFQREKEIERQLILSMQRDQRKKQMYYRMKLIKKKFKDEWNLKVRLCALFLCFLRR